MSSKLKTAALAISIAGAGVLVIAVISGVVFERAQRARDRERFPPVGRAVDIGGRTLNLYCSGKGQPAVIFESGATWQLYSTPKAMFENGAPRPGYSWTVVQRQVAELTTACWYDRAGSGWSDLGPYPRDSAAQARDLHALLTAAGVPGPYVLVAESSAVLDARVYTSLYPREVAGLVFVNGIHPDFFARTRPGSAKRVGLYKAAGRGQDIAAHVFNELGLYRLGSQRPPAPVPPGSGLTDGEWKTIWYLTQRSSARSALMQDIAAWQQAAAEARDAGSLGNRPLTVLSSQIAVMPDYRQSWMQHQAELAHLSARGKLQAIESASGDLLYEAPQAIVAAVRRILSEAGTPPPDR
jgi:pimeloyl-ACP methyl ester carboxylesterase